MTLPLAQAERITQLQDQREATPAEIERAHQLKHKAGEIAHCFTDILRMWHGGA